jgi:hypothetical protein
LGIFYDTRLGDPLDQDQADKFNFSYYLITSAPLTTDTTQNYATKINISPVDPDLIPYFQNAVYCRISADCTIRDNLCSYGAFNYYHPFKDGWLCRGKTDPDGRSLLIYDDTKQCKAQKEFAGPQCINQRCTASQVITQCTN